MRVEIGVTIRCLAWLLLGIIVICTCIALLNVVQEYFRPTYSGFNYWRPIILLPVTIMFSIFVATIVQGFATLLKWPKLKSPFQLFLVGGICGFSLSGSFFGHLLSHFFITNLNLEVLFTFMSLLIAFFVRYTLTR